MRLALNQFDFITIGIFDKGNDGGAVLHRAGLAHHLAAASLDLRAGAGSIGDFERDVAIGGPQFIVLGVSVVGQFEHGFIFFLAQYFAAKISDLGKYGTPPDRQWPVIAAL